MSYDLAKKDAIEDIAQILYELVEGAPVTDLKALAAGAARECVEAFLIVTNQPVPGHPEPERGTPPASPRKWDENVLEAMAVYGGHFVRELRQAYLAADDENRRRICAAFLELGQHYREMATRLRERDAEEPLDMPAAEVR